MNTPSKEATVWPELERIGTPPLPAFPVNALPPTLANWVGAESEATQTPLDMPALLAMAVCSATLAKCVEVQAWEGWSEPCNLYCVAIIDPANRKSAVFADATKPLREVESKIQDDLADQVAVELSERRQAEKRLQKLEKVAAENVDAKKRDAAKLEACDIAKQLAAWPEPTVPTMIVDDATSERLAILLEANGERIASMSAEGGVFELMAGKYSKNGATDIGIYLMGHSGDAVSVQRVSRPPVRLKSPALTMALTIQPEVLRGLATNPSFRGRGLLGRFIYAMPKSWIGRRKIAAPAVPEVMKLAYSKLIKTLAMITRDADGQPHRIVLSPDALIAFKRFSQWIEVELGSGSLEPMKDWGGKLGGATLRIAAVIHFAKHGAAAVCRDIDLATIKSAEEIARWAIPHAAAALGLLSASQDETLDDAEALLRWIRYELAGDAFDQRDAQRKYQSRFNGKPDRLKAALALLESTHHIAVMPGPKTGGKIRYGISPRIKRNLPEHADNCDNQATLPPSEPPLSSLSQGSSESENERVKVTI